MPRVADARALSTQGESQAAMKLVEAIQTIGDNANAPQLRYLNSLVAAAKSPASTILLPLPLELFHGFKAKTFAKSRPACPRPGWIAGPRSLSLFMTV